MRHFFCANFQANSRTRMRCVHGLTVRPDSRLCEAYISRKWRAFGRVWTLDEVVERMLTLHILYQHSDYQTILDTLIENERSRGYIRDFHEFVERVKTDAENAALRAFHHEQEQKHHGDKCSCGYYK